MDTNEPTDHDMQEVTTEESGQLVEKTPEETEATKTLDALEALPDLMEKLEEDNTQYQIHVQLIETLKQADLPEELERARMNMHQVFPLTEALWLDWINDAKKEANTEKGREKLMELYDLAQEDYLSINIWKSYMEFILEEFHHQFDNETIKEETETEEGIEKARKYLLHAVRATQFHIKQSQEIWKPYAEFELEILNRFKSPTQQKRVYDMFVTRLGVLHIDYQDTFDSFSSFITTWDNDNYESIMMKTTRIYSKTKKAAEERDLFEMKLISSGYALDTFYEYIENEKISKNMSSVNNVRCLYERAIVIYCLDPTLWDDYILYLIEKGRITSQLEPITLRAIRNCPWSGILFSHRARLWESENQEEDLMNDLFDTALTSKQLLSSMEDLITVLLAKLDYTRREIEWEDVNDDDLIDMEIAFVECLQIFNDAFPETEDPYYRIEKYYAYFAEKKFFKIDKARELWKGIVETHGRDAEAWIQYITFERNQGNYSVCESLFKKALQKNVDNPMRLIDTWNTMEHEFGSLESFETANILINRKVKTFSRQWQAALAEQEEYHGQKDRKGKAKKETEQEKKENEKRKKGLHRMEQKKKKKERKAAMASQSHESDKPDEFKKPHEFKKPQDVFKKPQDVFKKPQEVFKEPQEVFKEPEGVFKKPFAKTPSQDTVKEEKVDTIVEKSTVETLQEDVIDEEKMEVIKEIVEEEKKQSVVKANNEIAEDKPAKDTEGKGSSADESIEATLKRKASEGDLNEEEAKKHKSNEEETRSEPELDAEPPKPKKKFNPVPRPARSRRGRTIKLPGPKTLGRHDVQHAVTDEKPTDGTEEVTEEKPADVTEEKPTEDVSDETSKSNDDFRNMLLGRK